MATRGTVLPPVLQLRIARLHQGGMSIRAIARELGIDRWTVRKYLRGPAWQHPVRKAA